MVYCFFYLLILSSCESNKSSSHSEQYYPLRTFFLQEVDSLQRNSPIVSKTVRKDNGEEHKEIEIHDWENELGAFLSIDLSKPVYRDAFEIISGARTTRYLARDDSHDIRSIVLEKDSMGHLEKVSIERIADNFLYQNQEKLEYVRNGYYLLKKEQKIFLLGKSEYQIEGRF